MFLQGKENVSQAADDRKEKKALRQPYPRRMFLDPAEEHSSLPPLRAGLTVEAACTCRCFSGLSWRSVSH